VDLNLLHDVLHAVTTIDSAIDSAHFLRAEHYVYVDSIFFSLLHAVGLAAIASRIASAM